MTAAELKRMSPKQKENLFYNIPVPVLSGPINSEKDSIDVVIEQYRKTEVFLGDIQVLKEELSEMIA